MPRVIEVTIPSERTDALLRELSRSPAATSVRVQRGVSVKPPGDVVSFLTTDRDLAQTVQLLTAHGVGGDASTSIVTTEPLSVISPELSPRATRDHSKAIWEEIDWTLNRQSSMGANGIALMALGGALAAWGIATNSLHIVIGAMVVAPAFDPIARVVANVVSRGPGTRSALGDCARAYAAMLLGAAIAAATLRAMGRPVFAGHGQYYLVTQPLAAYWSTLDPLSLLVNATASLVGGALLVARRSTLTAGVLIALSLIPTLTIGGMGLVAGQFGLAMRSLAHFGVDVLLVFAGTAAVFVWHRRAMRNLPSLSRAPAH